jgi:hypothetical protein
MVGFVLSYLASFVLCIDFLGKMPKILESYFPHHDSLIYLFLLSSNQLSLANALIWDANYDHDLEIEDSDF